MPHVLNVCSRGVVWQMILPVLLMKGQYLQFSMLQKSKPLSLGAVPCLLFFIRLVLLSIKGLGCGVPTLGLFGGFCVRKSVLGHWMYPYAVVWADVCPQYVALVLNLPQLVLAGL